MSCFGFIRNLCRHTPSPAPTPTPTIEMRELHRKTELRPPSAADTRSDQPSTNSFRTTLDSRTLGGSQLTTDFRPPTPAVHVDAEPHYALLDYGATQQRREFENDIRKAKAEHGEQVCFTPVRDGDRAVGYILSSPMHVEHARAEGTLPALLLTGYGAIDRHHPYFRPAVRIDSIQLSPESAADPLIVARQLRREDPPAQVRRPGAHNASQITNYRIDSATLDPMLTASFVGKAGDDVAHLCPIDVFLAPPGADVYLSTIQRAIPPVGKYARICYARA